MKKIALFSLMCCLGGAYAVPALAGSCGAKSIDIGGLLGVTNQKPTDDEFLYTDPSDQQKATKAFNGSGTYKLNSYALECDNDYCSIHTVIYLPDGGIAGNTRGKYFMCNGSSVDDKWTVVGECRDGQEIRDLVQPFYVAKKNGVNKQSGRNYNVYQTFSAAFPCVCNGEVYSHDGKQYCRTKTAQKSPVSGIEAEPKTKATIPGTGVAPKPKTQDCPEGTTRAIKDIIVTKVCMGDKCVAIKKDQCYDTDFLKCMEAADRGEPANWNGKSCNCGDRMVWDNIAYKCVAKTGGNTVTSKTCKELYGKYPQRLACCEAGKATKWTGSVKNGTCSCVDTSKVWDSAKKQCITQDVVSEFSDCTYDYNVEIVCSNGTVHHERGSQRLKKSQLSGLACDDFNARFGADVKKWQELFGDVCQDDDFVPAEIPGLAAAQKTLEAFAASAEDNASVWKNAEGKFNTTRLASDVTAGVVLGTVGGVVTGVVVKKNQVKKGFEALHCTVGGQKVADWGDEFSVGLQR